MKPGAALTVGTTWLSSIDLAASAWSGSILTETTAAYIECFLHKAAIRAGGHCVRSNAPAPQRTLTDRELDPKPAWKSPPEATNRSLRRAARALPMTAPRRPP